MRVLLRVLFFFFSFLTVYSSLPEYYKGNLRGSNFLLMENDEEGFSDESEEETTLNTNLCLTGALGKGN